MSAAAADTRCTMMIRELKNDDRPPANRELGLSVVPNEKRPVGRAHPNAGWGGGTRPRLRAIDEARLEAAIQIAEDWLAPHVAGLRGETLEVADLTGRLVSGLQAVLESTDRHWTIESLERAFQQLVHLATGRVVSPAVQNHASFIVDILVLRELAHHGQLSSITLA